MNVHVNRQLVAASLGLLLGAVLGMVACITLESRQCEWWYDFIAPIRHLVAPYEDVC